MWSLKIAFVFILFCIIACSPRAEFLPDGENLKPATVGEPYYLRVNILGGRALGGPKWILGSVVPNDSGIALRYCPLPSWRITKQTTDTNDHNCIEIYGVPNKTGVIKITIGGALYGHMLASGSEFSKIYKLQVTQP
ncbi:hypothetical protein GW590_04720 [Rahnella sp. SAP-1]|uniref:Uncharacterized protein n=1 Tax=Rouxiella aceris TaxID=2703884 RepID=A0A848MFL2_9GAMM|nr:hypothetical protein [Rouxiella aceris]NMP26176.1 hypothetical protein [Rouxiella aceris]